VYNVNQNGLNHLNVTGVPGGHVPYSSSCSGIPVTVNHDTPQSEYNMSVTASCGSVAPPGLRMMLLGSGTWWYGWCKSRHELAITPNVYCRGEAWTVQYLTFRLKGARKVEIYVDDQKIYEVFTLTCTIIIAHASCDCVYVYVCVCVCLTSPLAPSGLHGRVTPDPAVV